MPRDPLGERWPEVYRGEPEVLQRFSRAQDRGGVLLPALLERAELAGRRVLEVGCGAGRWTADLARSARHLSALEPEPGLLALARREPATGARWMRGRAEALPFADGSVERIVAFWVYANLRPRLRAAAVQEARRAVGDAGELWLVENAGGDDYEALRRAADLPVEPEILPLVEEHGFVVASTLETELAFASEEEARFLLGRILGPRVEAELDRRPRRSFRHRVAFLRGGG